MDASKLSLAGGHHPGRVAGAGVPTDPNSEYFISLFFNLIFNFSHLLLDNGISKRIKRALF